MEDNLKLTDYIPPNFSIEKYKQSYDHGPLEWLSNIAARTKFGGHHEDYMLAEEDPEEIFNFNISLNIERGANRIINHNEPAYDVLKVMLNAHNIETLRLSRGQYLARESKLDKRVKKACKWYDNRSIEEPVMPPPEVTADFFAYFDKPISEYVKELDPVYIEYLSVDLSAPDEFLLEEFKSWLSKQRTKLSPISANSRRIITPAKFRRWHESRSLAYVDLKQWNEAKGRSLPHAVAGEILFSDYSYNDTRNRAGIVADTTKKNAREMFQRGTSITLMSQIVSTEF